MHDTGVAIKLVHIMTVSQSLLFLTGQVGYMKERGFDIVAITSPGDYLSRFAEQEGIMVHAIDMPRRITPWRDLVALAGLCRLLISIRPHIVHAHTPKGGMLGMVAAWLVGVPVRLYHMRGLPFTTASGLKRRLLLWTEGIACGLAHRTLCVSESVRALALEQHLCPPEKIAVLGRGSGNGVDADQRFSGAALPLAARETTRVRHHIPSDALVLGFVGRIVRSKGVVELAGAWRQLRKEFPTLHLVLVGPTEQQDPIPDNLEDELRADPRVRLVGEEWNIVPLYAAMDVLALPTHREGFPNVLLEAAAMQIPVVATRVPGCTDAVHDQVTGFLVPPYDAVRLAASIRRYLADPDLRRRHGFAAREWVLQEFRPQRIWQALYQEYIGCLKAQGLAPTTAPALAGDRRAA
jgi:glycosyltransferase involved in cell wall biosynthesis